MRYAGIIYDDTAAAPGLSLSLFTQGCPFHCKGCHNKDTWAFDGGFEYTRETEKAIINGLNANGVLRNLCIMGGEPLLEENLGELFRLVATAKAVYPEIQVYIWTGYTFDEIVKRESEEVILFQLLNLVDVLITGPYIEEQRDITNRWCGSANQEVIYLHTKK